ncbi:MAG: hypothetical protein QW051_03185 [Candidatus Aenigmatarchaeota archaeon]
MNCPKCDGGAYVSEEEVVNIVQNITPPRVILKVTYVCKSCGERFTRIYFEDIESSEKTREMRERKLSRASIEPIVTDLSDLGVDDKLERKTTKKKEPVEQLRFLDEL